MLKTILRVGNQLNDGAKQEGFTLDSLLKLQSAKAFDRKTSVLQYVVTLVHRNDPDCLKFPEDFASIGEAARLTLDTIMAEKNGIRDEFASNLKIALQIEQLEPTPKTGLMVDFFSRVRKMRCIILIIIISLIISIQNDLSLFFLSHSNYYVCLSHHLIQLSHPQLIHETIRPYLG